MIVAGYNLTDLKKKNEINRKKLAHNQRIRVIDISLEPGLLQPSIVVTYDDYRYSCRDYASITEVLYWIDYGIICVDTFETIPVKLKIMMQQYGC